MKPNVKIQVSPCEVVILIRDLPHMILRRADLTGMQAYIKNVGVREPVYFIEFTTHTGLVTADYDKRPLWEAILKGLRDARPFDHMQGSAALPGSA